MPAVWLHGFVVKHKTIRGNDKEGLYFKDLFLTFLIDSKETFWLPIIFYYAVLASELTEC
jgi:hypothetical protein